MEEFFELSKISDKMMRVIQRESLDDDTRNIKGIKVCDAPFLSFIRFMDEKIKQKNLITKVLLDHNVLVIEYVEFEDDNYYPYRNTFVMDENLMSDFSFVKGLHDLVNDHNEVRVETNETVLRDEARVVRKRQAINKAYEALIFYSQKQELIDFKSYDEMEDVFEVLVEYGPSMAFEIAIKSSSKNVKRWSTLTGASMAGSLVTSAAAIIADNPIAMGVFGGTVVATLAFGTAMTVANNKEKKDIYEGLVSLMRERFYVDNQSSLKLKK